VKKEGRKIESREFEAKAYRVKEEGSPLLSSSHGGLGSCYLVSGRVFSSLFGQSCYLRGEGRL
jgi:hypothetical protein